jgi:hypothetical protein
MTPCCLLHQRLKAKRISCHIQTDPLPGSDMRKQAAMEGVASIARDAVSRAVKTVQRHFVRRRYKEHASNEACANENYSKKADGDCFK